MCVSERAMARTERKWTMVYMWMSEGSLRGQFSLTTWVLKIELRQADRERPSPHWLDDSLAMSFYPTVSDWRLFMIHLDPGALVQQDRQIWFCSRKPQLSGSHHIQELLHVYRLEGNLQAQEDQQGAGKVKQQPHHPKDPKLWSGHILHAFQHDFPRI